MPDSPPPPHRRRSTPPGFSAGMIDMESNTTLVQCYPAHQAIPGGDGPFPAVLVLHDRLGLTSHVRRIANRLAHADFYALAPDFYGAPSIFAAAEPDTVRGAHHTFFDWSEDEAAREREQALTDERALQILEQAIVYAGGRAKARSGGVRLLGFGSGGRLAFLGAARFPDSVRAVVGFAPRDLGVPKPPGASKPSPLEEAGRIAAPVLLLYGRLDTEIPKKDVDAVETRLAALETAGRFRVERLRNAGPDFFCEERDTYRVGASRIAWERTLRLFRDGEVGPAAAPVTSP